MAAITKIEFWKDVGFIDGAVEIPSLSAADPVNPDITIEPEDPIIPSRDRFFSEFKLKEYYSELLTVSYMRITYQIKNTLGVNVPKVFYGWVKDVTLTSDGDLPLTTISWHIDEWRTWKANVTFGSGHVKRRPFVDIDTTPIQNYDYRYLIKGTSQTDYVPLCDLYFTYDGNPPRVDGAIWWIVFSFNQKDTGVTPPETTIEYGAIPVRIEQSEDVNGSHLPYTRLKFKATADNTTYDALSIRDVMSGLFDEKYGIAPSSINGVWLTPELFDLTIIHGEGTSANPLTLDIPVSFIQPSTKDQTFGYVIIRNKQFVKEHTLEVRSTTEISTETKHIIITDFEGSKVLELPYSMGCKNYDKYIILEADAAYLVFSFKDGLYGRTEGTTATIPLPQLPVNDNAFSEYSYSGQQEFDREMRIVQSNANAWKSSASGAGSGAMMGAFGPQGLLLGMAGGVAGGMIGYGVEMLYQNDEEQRLTERLKANQIPGLLMGSNIFAASQTFYGPCMVYMYPDDYSLTQIANTRQQFGVSVDELMSSTDSLIRTSSPTGYYNIQNLIVSGDVPVSAKRWIRNKFASGVRLI